MDVVVSGRGIKVTSGIEKHIEDRLSKLLKYDDRIIEAKVMLKVEKFRHDVDITILTKNATIVGVANTNDLYMSIDYAIAKLEAQLKKMRDKFKDKRIRAQKSKQHDRDIAIDELKNSRDNSDDDDDERDDNMPDVVAEKSSPKPMSLKEAKEQLFASDNDEFIVFKDQDTMKVKVLFKRKDGDFGLISVN